MKPVYLNGKQKSEGGVFGSLLLGILLFFVVVAIYIGYEAGTFLYYPASETPENVVVDIKRGSTFDRVAQDLYKAGAITSVDKFRMLAKYKGKLGAIQAGEFTVSTGWKPDRVLQQITSGRQTLNRLALREGLPWWHVAQLIEDNGFAKADEFEKVIHDPAFLKQYGIPFADAEGFLYPETYFLRKPKNIGGRDQAEALARLLVETFWKRAWPLLTQYVQENPGPRDDYVTLPGFALRNGVPVRVAAAGQPAPAGQTGQPAIPVLQAPFGVKDLRYIITLASLVEKETGVPAERPRVAGVYANRLRKGILLQCDPTIIYGVGKNHSGPIRRSQLNDAKNLYNTYKHPGLPPGPICSSGKAAMQAAVQPEQHEYIFFVATGKPDGTHTFTTNVRDHEKAVKVYRASQGR